MNMKKILSLAIVLFLGIIYIETNVYKRPQSSDIKDGMEVLADLNLDEKISEERAKEIVKNYLEQNNSYIPNHIEVDNEDNIYYLVHVYDIIKNDKVSHTATTGWFQVNKYTGEIIDIMQ